MIILSWANFPASLFKVNNRNTIKRCEICSEVAIKTPEPRKRRRSCIVIVGFEDITPLFNSVSSADPKQVNVCCVINTGTD